MTVKTIEGYVKVNAYSGYKANEKPVDFSVGDMKIKITNIINRWVEPDRDCFMIKGDNRKTYQLCWLREKDLWQVFEDK